MVEIGEGDLDAGAPQIFSFANEHGPLATTELE